MFTIDAAGIDKSLPVPVGTQLHGLLTYMLSFSDIPPGTKLPSVRQLAADLGISPMTVAQVYAKLRDAGLVEMRHGLGAFTRLDAGAAETGPHPLNALRSDIAALIDKADSLGVSTLSLISMVNAQAQMPRNNGGLDIVFVGIFEGPTRDYVAQLAPALIPADRVRLITLENLASSEPMRQACRKADIVLTFVNREAEVRALVDTDNVMSLRFIPSEQTRQNLARLDPRARVAAVTHFKEYIAIMRPSVSEFAPHVADIEVTWSSAPDLIDTLSRCSAVVFASGADHVAEYAPEGVPCFEFRHMPDPGAVETLLMPRLAALRSAENKKADTA